MKIGGQVMSNSKNKSILSLLLGLVIGIFIFYLINRLFSNSITYGGGYLQMGTGVSFGSTSSISLILILLIKVLFVLFIVGLVVGILVALTRYLFTDDDYKTISSSLKRQKVFVVKETCSSCGKEQHKEWKVCPYCGKEVEVGQTIKEVEVYE